MKKPKLFVCMGLQRSGNHAVLGWIQSLFPEAVFHNDGAHGLFLDPAAVLPEPPPACSIVSFEDSANRTDRPGSLLRESVTPPSPEIAERYELHRLVILRDPYNTWASRVAANQRDAAFGRKLSSDPSWELFRANWLDLAALSTDPEWRVVLFNRWKDDAGYRRALCAEFGGTYNEATLEAIPDTGGGSSFEGVPRPTYAQMLRQTPKYASPSFLRRLASHPGHYIRRFFSPPTRASQMAVERRWTTLLDHAECTRLFADAELRDVTARIFGPDLLPPKDAGHADDEGARTAC